MATKKEIQTIDFKTLTVGSIPMFEELKAAQELAVKENPFVKITDKATYEIAKKNRTALLTASTTFEKEQTNAVKLVNSFKDLVKNGFSTHNKTRMAYDKQQSEVKEYEDEVQAEKDRLAAEREIADQKVKDDISELIQGLETQTYEMTIANSDQVRINIGETKLKYQGTFEEFDIIFDTGIERVETLYATAKDTLEKEALAADEARKQSHKDTMQRIENAVKDCILESDIDTIENYGANVINLLKPEWNFEEFTPDFNTLKVSLQTKFDAHKEKLNAEKAAATKKAADDKELDDLRKFKNYNNRKEKFISSGFLINESGGFNFDGINFSKEKLETESEEEFQEGFIYLTEYRDKIKKEEESKVKESDESMFEEIAPTQEEINEAIKDITVVDSNQISNFEKAIDEVAENNIPTENVFLGSIITVGQLRDILKDYNDDVITLTNKSNLLVVSEGIINGSKVIFIN